LKTRPKTGDPSPITIADGIGYTDPERYRSGDSGDSGGEPDGMGGPRRWGETPRPDHSWLTAAGRDSAPIIETFEALDRIHSLEVAQFVDAQPQECWRNALLGVLRHPLLADGCYVEGIAVFCEKGGVENSVEDGAYHPWDDAEYPTQPLLASATPTCFAHPVEHGWVELPDGRIIDPTVVLLDRPTHALPGSPPDAQTPQARIGPGGLGHRAASLTVRSEVTMQAAPRRTKRAAGSAIISPPSAPPILLRSGWVVPHRLSVIYVAGPRYARESLWSLCHAEDARPYLPFVARDHCGGFSDPSYRAAYQLAIQVVFAIS